MGLLCDYFVASSDEAAIAMLEVPGGPAAAPAPGPPVLELKNIEPAVNMQTLEELLTGRSAEDVVRNPRQGNMLESDPDGAAIVSITLELQQALATSDADTLRAVAERWADTDELAGSDPDDLTDILLQLAQLAHEANVREHALYCWVSP
ncbi:hypothetical protein ACQEVZ_05510 [Dactylosporangium sp. CA-152071]|uniref:hypothetical protein n=1 Tax=Dactylosporangium sp. CA-152071 TaxID=3239933 RepID=UPI003D8A3EE4